MALYRGRGRPQNPVKTGVAPKTWSIHGPTIAMALWAPSSVPEFSPQGAYTRREIRRFCAQYRGQPHRGVTPNRRLSTPEELDLLHEWLWGTPDILEWFLSPDAYISPEKFPDFLIPDFGHLPVPTPYEVANYPGIYPAKFLQPGGTVFRAYCMGMTVPWLMQFTSLPFRHIETYLRDGLADMMRSDVFKFWCAHVDWKKVWWSDVGDIGMLQKMKLQHILRTDPGSLPAREVSKIVSSPIFWKMLKTGGLPQKTTLRPLLQERQSSSHTQRTEAWQRIETLGEE